MKSEAKILSKHDEALIDLISTETGIKPEDILDMDLFFADSQKSDFVGLNQDFISSPRLDNLFSSFYSNFIFNWRFIGFDGYWKHWKLCEHCCLVRSWRMRFRISPRRRIKHHHAIIEKNLRFTLRKHKCQGQFLQNHAKIFFDFSRHGPWYSSKLLWQTSSQPSSWSQ